MNDKAKHLRTSDYGMLCVIDMLLEMYCCLRCKTGKYKGVTGRYHVKGGINSAAKSSLDSCQALEARNASITAAFFLFKTSEKVKYLCLAVCVI